ncbi:NAD(P)-dependent oxidoreductase [Chiayiivirga flava]|uniref:Glutamate synthase (NADPH/NADH) small chain n=1 Tax=Chiayiivirga flava TaxID=659595 RepID=A0A7W8D304_9GAMM|nr:NAD(P)-dependent oxidoreductase [Chiayiivirga flava]MBB5206909.1 glutamate synthase (NADPH/NADH) small chain [Chiayiivirga flava]
MPRKDLGDIAPARLDADTLARNFSDVAPPLDRRGALIAAQRCFYCYDAPCIQACPTGIDIPSFIKRITTDNLKGAAADILGANILGGACARVCPTEILCEGSCVRNTPDDAPVQIGALQRYATDWVYDANAPLFSRAPDSGKHVAVVGAGPAGLACAHRLARAGHRVTLFDAKDKPGGLNEYGIAAYKVPGFAQREIDWLLSIGGITFQGGAELGRNLHLPDLRRDHDAVFLGLGLAGVNALGLDGEDLPGVRNAVDFIEELRQCADLATLPIGRRVVVIGGGNTAIDAAIQSKRLGAESVTLVYRRGPESMSATTHEQAFAKDEGVNVVYWAAPRSFVAQDGQLAGIRFEHTLLDDAGRLLGSGDHFTLDADTVLKAIGQVLVPSALQDGGTDLLDIRNGRIAVNADFETSLQGVYAGGDCVGGKVDLTVQAVEDGQRAAAAIDRALLQRALKAA